MTTRVRSEGTWKTPLSMWVRRNGGWAKVGQLHTRDGGDWVSDTPLAPGVPTISVVGGPYNATPPQLLLTPVASGGATPSYRLEEYRYDSAGSSGSRTLASTISGPWTSAGVTVQRLTSPPPGTKISYELRALGLGGSQSAAAVVRWQTGVDAVTNQTPNYGWGELPDWTSPAAYFTLTGTAPSSAARPLAHAYDAAGNSTYFEANATGGIGSEALGDGVELLGNGFLVGSATVYPGTLTLTWLNATKRRLDELRVTYRGRVGYVGTLGSDGIVSRGKSTWTLTGIGGTDRTGYCDGNYLGPLSYTAGAVSWSALNRERAAGSTVPVRCIKPPYYGVFGAESYSRLAVFDLRVRVREWVITSYTTTVVTPAVAGQAW
jgi:hypothetical protein